MLKMRSLTCVDAHHRCTAIHWPGHVSLACVPDRIMLHVTGKHAAACARTSGAHHHAAAPLYMVQVSIMGRDFLGCFHTCVLRIRQALPSRRIRQNASRLKAFED